jgi:hypothetical protein
MAHRALFWINQYDIVKINIFHTDERSSNETELSRDGSVEYLYRRQIPIQAFGTDIEMILNGFYEQSGVCGKKPTKYRHFYINNAFSYFRRSVLRLAHVGVG